MKCYIIEGIDRVGKSTIVDGMKTAGAILGNVPHLTQSPIVSKREWRTCEWERLAAAATTFKRLNESCDMHDVNIVFDRAHLSNVVYAKPYTSIEGPTPYAQPDRLDIDRFKAVDELFNSIDTTIILLEPSGIISDGEYSSDELEAHNAMFKRLAGMSTCSVTCLPAGSSVKLTRDQGLIVTPPDEPLPHSAFMNNGKEDA